MAKVELYHNDMSSCSQKVRLVLEEKSIRWTGHHMNLRKGETRTKSYVKNFNKNGVVPTLVYKDDIIIESSIIMEYLDNLFHNCFIGIFLKASLQISASLGIKCHEFQHSIIERNKEFLDGNLNYSNGSYFINEEVGLGVKL